MKQSKLVLGERPKIVRVEEPTEKHELYRVWFSRGGVEYPSDLTVAHYKVLALKTELEQAGADPTKLDELEDAVRSAEQDDRTYDED